MSGSNRRRVGHVVGLTVLALVGAACAAFEGRTSTFTPDTALPVSDGAVIVRLDQPLAQISPLIRGASGNAADLAGAGVTLNSWGGNRATRYNFQLGNAWNLGRPGGFRNEGVASTSDLAGDWLAANQDAGIASRIAVPLLGWVARDNDPRTCSFPDDQNGCLAGDTVTCLADGPVADPNLANVGSSPTSVSEWIAGTRTAGRAIGFLAVGDAPERWGVDHADVHPACTTYTEVLDTYVTYAETLRRVAPDVALTGPVMCCWFGDERAPGPPDPGPLDGSEDDLLTWFLRNVAQRPDPTSGAPLLDVVDVQYRPRADVANSRDDPGTNEARISAVRELWDAAYRYSDPQSGVLLEAVEFIPRLRRIVDEFLPGTPLMISDWTFGNTESFNGALAIADALGVFALEGLAAAVHADGLAPGSPGWFAFKMFGNYDDQGSAFEGVAYRTEALQLRFVQAFSAVDDDRVLRIVVVNNSTDVTYEAVVDIRDIPTIDDGSAYVFASSAPDRIQRSTPAVGPGSIIVVPPASITMLEFRLQDPPTPLAGVGG